MRARHQMSGDPGGGTRPARRRGSDSNDLWSLVPRNLTERQQLAFLLRESSRRQQTGADGEDASRGSRVDLTGDGGLGDGETSPVASDHDDADFTPSSSGATHRPRTRSMSTARATDSEFDASPSPSQSRSCSPAASRRRSPSSSPEPPALGSAAAAARSRARAAASAKRKQEAEAAAAFAALLKAATKTAAAKTGGGSGEGGGAAGGARSRRSTGAASSSTSKKESPPLAPSAPVSGPSAFALRIDPIARSRVLHDRSQPIEIWEPQSSEVAPAPAPPARVRASTPAAPSRKSPRTSNAKPKPARQRESTFTRGAARTRTLPTFSSGSGGGSGGRRSGSRSPVVKAGGGGGGTKKRAGGTGGGKKHAHSRHAGDDFSQWSAERQNAWKCIKDKPNDYYHHFLPPGERPVRGSWSAEETKNFLQTLRERPVFDNSWGFFAMSVRGRTGAQCQSHFNALKARNKIDSQILYAIAHPYGDDDEEEDGNSEGESNNKGVQALQSSETLENDENAAASSSAPSAKAVVRVKQENERRYEDAASAATSKGKKRRLATTLGKKRKAKKRKTPTPTPKGNASSDDDTAPTRRSLRRRPASASSGPTKLVALPDDYRSSAPKKRKLKGKEREGEVSDENAPVSEELGNAPAQAQGEHRVRPPRVSVNAPTVSRRKSPPPSLARTGSAAESFRQGRRLPLSPIKSNSNNIKASRSPRAANGGKGAPRARVSPLKQNLRKSADAPPTPLGDFIDTSRAPSVAKSIQKRLFAAFASPSESAPPSSAGKRARLTDHREKGRAANDVISAFSSATHGQRSLETPHKPAGAKNNPNAAAAVTPRHSSSKDFGLLFPFPSSPPPSSPPSSPRTSPPRGAGGRPLPPPLASSSPFFPSRHETPTSSAVAEKECSPTATHRAATPGVAATPMPEESSSLRASLSRDFELAASSPLHAPRVPPGECASSTSTPGGSSTTEDLSSVLLTPARSHGVCVSGAAAATSVVSSSRVGAEANRATSATIDNSSRSLSKNVSQSSERTLSAKRVTHTQAAEATKKRVSESKPKGKPDASSSVDEKRTRGIDIGQKLLAHGAKRDASLVSTGTPSISPVQAALGSIAPQSKSNEAVPTKPQVPDSPPLEKLRTITLLETPLFGYAADGGKNNGLSMRKMASSSAQISIARPPPVGAEIGSQNRLFGEQQRLAPSAAQNRKSNEHVTVRERLFGLRPHQQQHASHEPTREHASSDQQQQQQQQRHSLHPSEGRGGTAKPHPSSEEEKVSAKRSRSASAAMGAEEALAKRARLASATVAAEGASAKRSRPTTAAGGAAMSAKRVRVKQSAARPPQSAGGAAAKRVRVKHFAARPPQSAAAAATTEDRNSRSGGELPSLGNRVRAVPLMPSHSSATQRGVGTAIGSTRTCSPASRSQSTGAANPSVRLKPVQGTERKDPAAAATAKQNQTAAQSHKAPSLKTHRPKKSSSATQKPSTRAASRLRAPRPHVEASPGSQPTHLESASRPPRAFANPIGGEPASRARPGGAAPSTRARTPVTRGRQGDAHVRRNVTLPTTLSTPTTTAATLSYPSRESHDKPRARDADALHRDVHSHASFAKPSLPGSAGVASHQATRHAHARHPLSDSNALPHLPEAHGLYRASHHNLPFAVQMSQVLGHGVHYANALHPRASFPTPHTSSRQSGLEARAAPSDLSRAENSNDVSSQMHEVAMRYTQQQQQQRALVSPHPTQAHEWRARAHVVAGAHTDPTLTAAQARNGAHAPQSTDASSRTVADAGSLPPLPKTATDAEARSGVPASSSEVVAAARPKTSTPKPVPAAAVRSPRPPRRATRKRRRKKSQPAASGVSLVDQESVASSGVGGGAREERGDDGRSVVAAKASKRPSRRTRTSARRGAASNVDIAFTIAPPLSRGTTGSGSGGRSSKRSSLSPAPAARTAGGRSPVVVGSVRAPNTADAPGPRGPRPAFELGGTSTTGAGANESLLARGAQAASPSHAAAKGFMHSQRDEEVDEDDEELLPEEVAGAAAPSPSHAVSPLPSYLNPTPMPLALRGENSRPHSSAPSSAAARRSVANFTFASPLAGFATVCDVVRVESELQSEKIHHVVPLARALRRSEGHTRNRLAAKARDRKRARTYARVATPPALDSSECLFRSNLEAHTQELMHYFSLKSRRSTV